VSGFSGDWTDVVTGRLDCRCRGSASGRVTQTRTGQPSPFGSVPPAPCSRSTRPAFNPTGANSRPGSAHFRPVQLGSAWFRPPFFFLAEFGSFQPRSWFICAPFLSIFHTLLLVLCFWAFFFLLVHFGVVSTQHDYYDYY